ncbi:Mitotic spindle assembly checkpoint protein MAD2A [Oopsacas minuta]|uniref:Mitotic spindle assembly checkpoint protein MAD2A n=1 Tax=Oopsacas minuta TaxID=111878 RepID=A0AAV7JCD4_9METZ|nr:Mitotic spindle assembly checkpoint protein MAD2A [Oopsacas minuta]
MSMQVFSVSGSNQQMLTYLELCICHILKLRSVLPESSFYNENYLEMVVSKLSDSFDKNFLDDAISVLRGWIQSKHVHCIELILYESLNESIVEKWDFSLDYTDKQVSIRNTENSISAAFKDIELKTQLCMLQLPSKLSYDIIFKVNESATLEKSLKQTTVMDNSTSDLTEVPFGNIITSSHTLKQSCFTAMDTQ